LETKNSDTLFNWRREVVTNGVGVFNPSTAVSAKGAIITNADGEELIDFVGGIGVLNSGHCPEPVVKAIQEQAAKLIHTCFNVATYSVYMELADELISLVFISPQCVLPWHILNVILTKIIYKFNQSCVA
jgi:4-aminobutyrate aminotransferase / (S)-3-amino-2-methylpropionate transaminase / 5-aminovalerate transaminase